MKDVTGIELELFTHCLFSGLESSLCCFSQVGLFPGHCVELINQKVPQSVTNSVPKPGEYTLSSVG